MAIESWPVFASAGASLVIGWALYKSEVWKNDKLLREVDRLQSADRIIEIATLREMEACMSTSIFIQKAPCFHPSFYFADKSGRRPLLAELKYLVVLSEGFDFTAIPGDVSERIERVGSGRILKEFERRRKMKSAMREGHGER